MYTYSKEKITRALRDYEIVCLLTDYNRTEPFARNLSRMHPIKLNAKKCKYLYANVHAVNFGLLPIVSGGSFEKIVLKTTFQNRNHTEFWNKQGIQPRMLYVSLFENLINVPYRVLKMAKVYKIKNFAVIVRVDNAEIVNETYSRVDLIIEKYSTIDVIVEKYYSDCGFQIITANLLNIDSIRNADILSVSKYSFWSKCLEFSKDNLQTLCISVHRKQTEFELNKIMKTYNIVCLFDVDDFEQVLRQGFSVKRQKCKYLYVNLVNTRFEYLSELYANTVMDKFEKIIIQTHGHVVDINPFWRHNNIDPLCLFVFSHKRDLIILLKLALLYKVHDLVIVVPAHVNKLRDNINHECATIDDVIKLHSEYRGYNLISFCYNTDDKFISPEMCLKNISIYKNLDDTNILKNRLL